MNRSRDVSMRQTYRYGSRLGRMLELSMVTFGSRQIPTIFLQHLQNIFDFVLFHIIECFDYAGKGTNNNTFKQIFALKVLKDNERCTNPKRVLHGMNPWKQLPCSAIVIFVTKNIKMSCKSYSSFLAIQAQASASARALWCWVRPYPQ